MNPIEPYQPLFSGIGPSHHYGMGTAQENDLLGIIPALVPLQGHFVDMYGDPLRGAITDYIGNRLSDWAGHTLQQPRTYG